MTTKATNIELTWDQRILAQLPPGVDRSQIRENLKLSPTERVEQMLEYAALLEETRGKRRVPAPPSR